MIASIDLEILFRWVFVVQVCLGYVHAPESQKITTDYIRRATYEIDIATKRFKARPNLYQPSEMGPTIQLSTP